MIEYRDAKAQLHEKIAKLKSDLYSLGVCINDVKYNKIMSNSDRNRAGLISNFDSHPISNYMYDYSTVWDLQLTEDQVHNLIQSAEHIKSYAEENHHLKTSCRQHEQALLNLNSKLDKFKYFLKKNPELEDHWDEMMTLAKLYGFNETII